MVKFQNDQMEAFAIAGCAIFFQSLFDLCCYALQASKILRPNTYQFDGTLHFRAKLS